MRKRIVVGLLIGSLCTYVFSTFVIYTEVHPDLFINTSGSAARGLWTMYDEDRAPRPGDWVVICPPIDEDMHRLLFLEAPRGDASSCISVLMLKQVAAVPGDLVTVNGLEVTTPLATVRAVDTGITGVSLPKLTNGSSTVATDQYWVLNPHHERSIDSRYFGPIDTASIRRYARPLLVERHDG